MYHWPRYLQLLYIFDLVNKAQIFPGVLDPTSGFIINIFIRVTQVL